MKFQSPSSKSIFIPSRKKISPLESNILAWCVLLLFLFKVISILFLFNFPYSTFFAEISKNVLLNLTNQERKSLGVTPLRENSKLNRAAYLKAKDMLGKDYFAHTSPDGLNPWYWFSKVGYNYQYAGENLAIDFLDSEELYQAWDNSPSHRENIINSKYKEIGIAVLTGEFEGAETTVVVQLFGAPIKALAKEPSPTITPKTTPSPPATTPQSISTPTAKPEKSLCGYYEERGKGCPSLEERAILYEKYGLGSATTYRGTVEQNTALLNKLLEEEKRVAEEKPKKEEPEVTAEKEKKEPVLPEKPQIQEEPLYKFSDYMSKNYESITQKTFLVVLSMIILSILFEIIKGGISLGSLFLKGSFYMFLIVALILVDKEIILKLVPRTLQIF